MTVESASSAIHLSGSLLSQWTTHGAGHHAGTHLLLWLKGFELSVMLIPALADVADPEAGSS